MRTYFKLLRLPYQMQLGPIFAWGFWLGGGNFASANALWRFVAVFAIFHVGAFGGMTALNSFYDRDETPIGGMWNPPPIPPKLLTFAWAIQLGGLVLLLPFSAVLCAIYAALLLLSWLYSHPKPRGKGRVLASVLIVSLGQGMLDCGAGAFAASATSSTRLAIWFWLAAIGATSTVIAFFPLTQLYQVREDLARGDKTLASWLLNLGGRRAVFAFSAVFSALGTLFNSAALWRFQRANDAVILLVAGIAPLIFLAFWQREEPNEKTDFQRVHLLLRSSALVFGAFVLLRLCAS